MKIVKLVQGSPEWHVFRAKHHTASEAPAMMGASQYMSRDELLKQKKFGEEKTPDSFLQSLYDKGHEAEKLARVILEENLGDEFYPATGVDDDDYLSASFDGITMDEETLFEHKLCNQNLDAQISTGELPPHYYWQLEHQLLVSGALRVVFVCSDGTRENWSQLTYESKPERRAALLAGWKQFDEDLKSYTFKEQEVLPKAATIVELPTLSIELVGEVKASNLEVYQSKALAFIKAINTDLQTDQDFVDAENVVKFCDKAEKELELVKKQALGQTQTIDTLFKIVDSLKDEMKAKRLMLDKLVKNRKEEIRAKLIQDARKKFGSFIFDLDKTVENVGLLQVVAPDFIGAIKGKKTIKSVEEAINDEMARVKILAQQVKEKVEKNLSAYNDIAKDHKFLFSDLNQIVFKDGGDFVLFVQDRIAKYTASEKQKRDAEVKALADAEIKKRETEAKVLAEAKKVEQSQPNVVSTPTPEPIKLSGEKKVVSLHKPATVTETLTSEPSEFETDAPTSMASEDKVGVLAKTMHAWALHSPSNKWDHIFSEIATLLITIYPDMDVSLLVPEPITKGVSL